MIVAILHQEHRNIEKILLVLEQELSVFDRGERPDYEVVRAVISYFEVYPDAYHHPQEDMVFKKLKARDPAWAANIWRSGGGAPATIVMGGALEFAKLVGASWLSRSSSTAFAPLRWAIFAMVVALMGLNAMGCYGSGWDGR
jgi:hypothetical protein